MICLSPRQGAAANTTLDSREYITRAGREEAHPALAGRTYLRREALRGLTRWDRVLLRRAGARRLDFLRGRDFAGLAAAAICRRRAAAQPGMFTFPPRPRPSASAGTFSVMTEPAPTDAPSSPRPRA